MTTLRDLQSSYRLKSKIIKKRLSEFENVINHTSDDKLFEELVFCILTAGTSAGLCLKAIEEVKDIIHTGSKTQIRNKLRGCYRFYNVRADYIFTTREYLRKEFNFRIRDMLLSFQNPTERRDFIALSKNIRGISYKESSHYLRNIGFKGYSILDKHIINSLYELGVIKNCKTPTNRRTYLDIEKSFKEFAKKNEFDFDELDLLIWSEKTGTILK